MSKSIAVPETLYDKAAALASREFIESRAGLFNRGEFERALNDVPDAEPEDRDRLQ